MTINANNLSCPTDQSRRFATGHCYWICDDDFHSLKCTQTLNYSEKKQFLSFKHLSAQFSFFMRKESQNHWHLNLHIGVLLPGCVDPLTPVPAIPLKLVGVTLPGLVAPPAVLLTLELGVRRWFRNFSSRRHFARRFENQTWQK